MAYLKQRILTVILNCLTLIEIDLIWCTTVFMHLSPLSHPSFISSNSRTFKINNGNKNKKEEKSWAWKTPCPIKYQWKILNMWSRWHRKTSNSWQKWFRPSLNSSKQVNIRNYKRKKKSHLSNSKNSYFNNKTPKTLMKNSCRLTLVSMTPMLPRERVPLIQISISCLHLGISKLMWEEIKV